MEEAVMLKYLLMLKQLGIKGVLIDNMVKHFKIDEFTMLFTGNAFELQFKYNLFNEDEIEVFFNTDKIRKAEQFVDNLIKKNQEEGITILTYYDKEYPQSLKLIKQRPMFLYVKGNRELLNTKPAIACVGTRKPSPQAIKAVNDMVKVLADEEIVIISGLAKGIDTLSHKACLRVGGKTIAVLAHGLDTVYPKENKELAKAILDNGGVLISEYPVGDVVKKGNFVNRNRIVSGLSQGVVIFEASEKSGTMHTARFAYKQQKKLLCPVMVGNEHISLSSGVMKLLNSKSAYPVESPIDVINLIVKEEASEKGEAVEASTAKPSVDQLSKEKRIEEIQLNLDKKMFDEVQLLARKKGLNMEEIIVSSIADYIKSIKEEEDK
jgi:DNA processing protein